MTLLALRDKQETVLLASLTSSHVTNSSRLLTSLLLCYFLPKFPKSLFTYSSQGTLLVEWRDHVSLERETKHPSWL